MNQDEAKKLGIKHTHPERNRVGKGGKSAKWPAQPEWVKKFGKDHKVEILEKKERKTWLSETEWNSDSSLNSEKLENEDLGVEAGKRKTKVSFQELCSLLL